MQTRHMSPRRLAASACLIMVGLAAAPVAHGDPAGFATIASFGRGSSPAFPEAGLIAINGALYGTSVGGGTHRKGAVFRLTPSPDAARPATVQVLYSFGASKTDGTSPDAGVTADPSGNLYGTTGTGGLHGAGTVFKLTAPAPGKTAWTETILYSFMGGADGADPVTSLLRDAAGNLYGTTSRAGLPGCNLAGCGTIFRVTPPREGGPSTFQTLYQFKGNATDGGTPTGALIPRNGQLYGVAQFGGASRAGTAYVLTPPQKVGAPWTEATIFDFPGGASGGSPVGTLTFDPAGVAYGTTLVGGRACVFSETGCGTVFSLTPPKSGTQWREKVLFAFSGGADGALPVSGVTRLSNGVLYGTTEGDFGEAASQINAGSIFKLEPQASGGYREVTLHKFTAGADGRAPRSTPVRLGDYYYGLTSDLGVTGGGTAFQFRP